MEQSEREAKTGQVLERGIAAEAVTVVEATRSVVRKLILRSF